MKFSHFPFLNTRVFPSSRVKVVNFPLISIAKQPSEGQDLLISEASGSHSDTPQSVGLLWTSDQPDPENSTLQNATLTRDRLP